MQEKDQFSFVFKRGKTSAHVVELVEAVKQMMEPYTYQNFRMRKMNSIHDLVAVAGTLNVQFFVEFTSNGIGTNLTIVKVPQGPTLSFKIL